MRGFLTIWVVLGLCFFGIPNSYADTKAAKPKGRYASIIVDTDNLDIIHARQIDEIRYPASLTKVMTLYLTFEAINAGTLKLNQKIKVSRTAARTAPTKLGLRAGQTVTVETLIKAVAVRSANDAAVVLAEHFAGSEEAFAIQMTQTARNLGMSRTTFKTANGLPHPEQVTTARDMAKLANAVLTHHKRHYHYFGLKSFSYGGRTHRNTNRLLTAREDVDGFKTGFTNASGYNLIVSATRDGRRLIAVVLGGASGASRNSHMSDLIDRGFDVMGLSPQTLSVNAVPRPQTVKPKKPKISTVPNVIRLRGQKTPIAVPAKTKSVLLPQGSWSIQLGQFETQDIARAHLQTVSLLPELNSAKPSIVSRGSGLSARMIGLSAQSARAACKKLEKSRHGCLIIGPSS